MYVCVGIYICVQQIRLYLHLAEEVWSDGYSVKLLPVWKITDHTTQSLNQHNMIWHILEFCMLKLSKLSSFSITFYTCYNDQ